MAASTDQNLHQTTSRRCWSGGCHCRAIRFAVRAPEPLQGVECNCSVCSMCGYLHLIVPSCDFQLLKGADQLREYRFGTGVARHLFCTHCGIKSHYVPRSHPDGYSVNLRCLDDLDLNLVTWKSFDGRHWEDHIQSLLHAEAQRCTPATTDYLHKNRTMARQCGQLGLRVRA